MGNRIIISSDHVDSHNEVMTKEALESGAKIINGDRCVKWTVEHKRDIPPLGKIDDAEVIEKDGHFYLTANEVEYDTYEEIPWDKNLIKASCSTNSKPFNETSNEVPNHLTIHLDPHIFKTYDDYFNYQDRMEELESELISQEYGRKALINDPEIIIELAEYYFLYQI